ncbi:hypothetical protein SAMN06297229_1343 [Pseudidiomarina planktonica]|uniref:DUF1315 domain-containing protein n=1 Tax=Pseudidiomarina planktonica TaxID=1323738 RepID=A0A1Y6EZT9_9GAMM|nr:DUF1315 family protein [Pseudidiomarina planktonica]RUO65269.1 DUF1315 domain-containing protein [Pseudidiomarina planktonica]SMQ65733.1 hypothetical protein SAMN06297229_1343 [Pseudidiomarina planktonica]
MKFDDLIASISRETFERLVTAVETGRWPDGAMLSEPQKEQTLQLIIAYQAKYLPGDEPFRVGADGQLVTKTKKEMRASLSASDQNARNNLEQSIARFPLTDTNSDS